MKIGFSQNEYSEGVKMHGLTKNFGKFLFFDKIFLYLYIKFFYNFLYLAKYTGTLLKKTRQNNDTERS